MADISVGYSESTGKYYARLPGNAVEEISPEQADQLKSNPGFASNFLGSAANTGKELLLGAGTLMGDGWSKQELGRVRQEQAVREMQSPVSTMAGSALPYVATAAATAGMGTVPMVAAEAALGAASMPEDPLLGAAIGGGLAAVVPGMSSMASRMASKDISGALSDGFIRRTADRFAPSYSGFNQSVTELNDVISRKAAQAVGLGDEPLTATGLINARNTTKAGYDSVIERADMVKNPTGTPTRYTANDLTAAMEDSLVNEGFNETAIKSALRQAKKAMPNAEFATFGDVHKVQSMIGKMANDAMRSGNTFKGELLDTAHTGVMNLLESGIDTGLAAELGVLRNQYRNQSILLRSGIIGEQGSLNIPTLLSATMKNPTAEMGVIRDMAAGMKDMGSVKASHNTASDLTKRGISAGLGSIVGGIPGALMAGALEPIVARASSFAVKHIVGESAMAARIRMIGNAQEAAKTSGVGPNITAAAAGAGRGVAVAPEGIPVSPNAGKFGQGGGIGGFTSGKPSVGFTSGKPSVGFNYKSGVQYDVNETLQQAAKMGLISDPATTAGGTFNTQLKALTRDLLKAHPAPIQGTQNRFGQWLGYQQQQGLTNGQILSKINSVRSSVTDAPSISSKGIFDINNPVSKTHY